MFNKTHNDITVPDAEISPLEYGLKAQHRDGLNIMEEIWKDIVGYEGYYRISNSGIVKSLGRIIYRNGPRGGGVTNPKL